MKIGGQILWNALPICETFKISCLMGKLHTKDDLGNHFKNRSFRSFHWLSISLSLRKTSQESINLERKSYLDCSSDTHCTRGECGKGDVLVADLEGLETMDASENLFEKTQCERGDISQRKRRIYFSNRRWTNSTFWRRSGLENIHLGTASTSSRRKSRRFSWRIRRVSSTTARLISGCGRSVKTIFGPCRVKLYSPRDESFPIPLKYIDVSRTHEFGCQTGETHR